MRPGWWSTRPVQPTLKTVWKHHSSSWSGHFPWRVLGCAASVHAQKCVFVTTERDNRMCVGRGTTPFWSPTGRAGRRPCA